MLKRVNLPEDSNDYIRHELSLGNHLSQQLMNLDLKDGDVHTYLPQKLIRQKQIDYSESLEFLTGYKVVKEFDFIIEEAILKFLGKDPQRIVIFETFWIENDTLASRRSLQYFVIDDELYTFIKGNDKNKLVNVYIQNAHAYPTVITLVDIKRENLVIKHQCKFDDKDVPALVK